MKIAFLLRMLVVFILLFGGGAAPLIAQDKPAQTQPTASQKADAATDDAVVTPGVSTLGKTTPSDNTVLKAIRKTSAEVWLGAQVIFLSVLSLVILCVLGRKSDFNADFQKTFLIIVVISAASFLIVAGYTDQQLAPMFSLFGAIVGYLFGKGDRPAAPAAANNGPRQD
jgi:hypothetical protein